MHANMHSYICDVGVFNMHLSCGPHAQYANTSTHSCTFPGTCVRSALKVVRVWQRCYLACACVAALWPSLCLCISPAAWLVLGSLLHLQMGPRRWCRHKSMAPKATVEKACCFWIFYRCLHHARRVHNPPHLQQQQEGEGEHYGKGIFFFFLNNWHHERGAILRMLSFLIFRIFCLTSVRKDVRYRNDAVVVRKQS